MWLNPLPNRTSFEQTMTEKKLCRKTAPLLTQPTRRAPTLTEK